MPCGVRPGVGKDKFLFDTRPDATRHPFMLIGLDAIPLTEPRTGVGHYTFQLARSLACASPSDSFELLYPSSFPPIDFDEDAPQLPPLPRALDDDGDNEIARARELASNLKAVRVPVGFIRRHWWSTGLPSYVRRTRLELFHGTNYDVPLWGGAPSVMTVHDLSLLLHPETHEARRVRRARRRLPLMMRAATAVITPTESVRREVCEHLGVAPAKVFAVPEASRASFRPLDFGETVETRRRLGVGEAFLLAVGTVEPRKNLGVLLRAFEDVVTGDDRHRSLQLVVAGGKGWLTAPLFAQLQKSAVAEHVLFTGYLSDADLRALYSSCRAFVYPSLYEGFGLPPLEAMACGAPVVASRIPSLVETTGGAARLFDLANPRELAQHLVELLRDEGARVEASEAGLRRAAEFSWERAAELTLQVYGEALRRFRS